MNDLFSERSSPAEPIGQALERNFGRGSTAERLGFGGFKGKVVADIGTRDGRFVPMFRKLGAREVYGVDPNVEDLNKAIGSGILDREHAIPTKLEEMPYKLRGVVDVGVVFNFNIPISERSEFFQALREILAPSGEVVMTVAEREIYWAVIPLMEEFFNLEYTQLRRVEEDYPHKYLVIGKIKAKTKLR